MSGQISLCNATSPDIIYRLRQLVGNNAQVQSRQYNHPVGTIKAIANCGKVGVVNDIVDSKKCQSIKLWWLDASSFDEDSVYCGEEFNPDAGCDVPEGCQITSKCIDHKPNLFSDKTVSVCDEKCDSEIMFAEETAAALAGGMNLIRKKINNSAIKLLAECATDVSAIDDCPPEIFDIQGTKVYLTKETLGNKDDLIAEIAALAAVTGIAEYKIHSGRIWLSDSFVTQYKALSQCCGTPEAAAALRDLLDMMITFDAENMYKCLGEKAMFLWNPNQVGYYNFSDYPETPTLVDKQNGVYHWSVADPELVWTRNIYNENGVLVSTETVPVRYDIEYKKTCKGGRTARGNKIFLHSYRIIHKGGIFIAPADENGNTGIIQFVQA